MALSFTPLAADESQRIQAIRPLHRPPPVLTPGSFRADSESSTAAPKALPLVPSAARLTVSRTAPDFPPEHPSQSSSRLSRAKSNLSVSRQDAATSPPREGNATIVRVAPDPPDIMTIRPRAASPLRALQPPSSVGTSTSDTPFSGVEAFTRRGQLRTPLSIGCARHYSHSIGFYGSTIQTPRRVPDGPQALPPSVTPLSQPPQAHFIQHSTEWLPPSAAAPVLCSSWVSRY